MCLYDVDNNTKGQKYYIFRFQSNDFSSYLGIGVAGAILAPSGECIAI